ncbi:MAG: Ni/Fe-hydrogenase, b-type cytochrome subunit [Candidatus Bipolaricaulia bacterium]
MMSGVSSDTTPVGADQPEDPSRSSDRTYYVAEEFLPASIRAIHWINVVCVFVLAGTGFLLSRTFPLGAVDPQAEAFLDINRKIHILASVVIIACVLARIALAFVGPPVASWRYLIPLSRERWRNFYESLLFYTFIRREHPHGAGYNALQGIAYAGFYAMAIAIAVTGLFLVSSGQYVGFWNLGFGWLGNLFGGDVIEQARWIHRVLTWLILLFAAVHIYLVVWYELIRRKVTISSIISGFTYEPVSREHKRVDDGPDDE